MSSANVVPPFRAPLLSDQASEHGSGQVTTARPWYLFFEYLARTLGIQAGMVSSGTHQNRLARSTADLPNGAFWVETDRGNVIYENQGGVWKYVAGSMWGTLSPDQRPADLGANDNGFDFRDSGNSPFHEYIWNGSAWSQVNFPVTPPAGATGQVQFNNAGAFGASANLFWDIANSRLGIGTASVPNMLTVVSPSVGSPPAASFVSTGQPNASYIHYGATGDLYWRSASASGKVILQDTGGNVGIGTGSPGYQLTLSADSAAKPTTSTWSVSSDIRTKQNVEDVTDDSLAMLERLRWVRFEYNGQGQTPKDQKAIGLSAQDARRHMPEAVRGSEETELLAIDYHHIIVHTARAVQQLAKELRELKQKLAP